MSDLRRFNRTFYLVAAVAIAVIGLKAVTYALWALSIIEAGK